MAVYVKNNKDFGQTGTIVRECPHCGEETTLGEVERGREHFEYGYLPPPVRRLLREAFGCYSADLYLGFAILCRQALTASGSTRSSFERLFDEAAALGGIGSEIKNDLRAVLFGSREDPEIDAGQASVLIELVKDMFRQRYVRPARLARAIEVRRFFANEARAAGSASQPVTRLDPSTAKR